MKLEFQLKSSTTNLVELKVATISIEGTKEAVEILKLIIEGYIRESNKERSYPWELE